MQVFAWEFESPLRHHEINRAVTLMGCSPFVLSGSDRTLWPVEIYTGRLEKTSAAGNIHKFNMFFFHLTVHRSQKSFGRTADDSSVSK